MMAAINDPNPIINIKASYIVMAFTPFRHEGLAYGKAILQIVP
ncbi:hypothetical protein N781_03785 [Pontibacillus halophilus JSM 076056 = DSM 19796]|uniref:Uncharacterized protein n=1 Tax=Pontibacillus halophilus JSM 076056 = DSM 19796 TaxID=1385510 RepID=A0A0A5GEN8_9BACI|nr:hypothetical protein N781_03785 [Pontibacillus halophilus JSM 076056 = DSM 19796]